MKPESDRVVGNLEYCLLLLGVVVSAWFVFILGASAALTLAFTRLRTERPSKRWAPLVLAVAVIVALTTSLTLSRSRRCLTPPL